MTQPDSKPGLPTRFELPEGAEHPKLRAAFEYWRSKTPPGRLPGRQHIDPLEMKPFLPNLVLFDVERDSGKPRFRVRLEGTLLVNAFARETTGLYVDDLVRAGGQPQSLERMIDLLTTRLPYYAADGVPLPDKEHVMLQRIVMPLASDGETVDMLMACCALVRGDTAAKSFLPD